MLGAHFQRRGYPASMVEEALIRARRLSRDDLLHPIIKPKTTVEASNLYAIANYTPGDQPLKKIIQTHWPILGKTHTTATLFSKDIIYGHRRNENLRDLLVKARLPEPTTKPKLTQHDPVSPMHKCRAIRQCNYCPVLDHTGTITSTTTKRQYFTKKHISCRSNNLIYCITCKQCSLQYVGQTSNHIGERFKMHFQNIKTATETKLGTPARNPKSKPQKEEPIGRHFSLDNHHGTSDIIIHVLDFISAPSKSPPALALRDNLERKWIHRLQTLAPRGLNLAD